MKPGAKRRRSKEEIKQEKEQEATKAKEMADALIELEELRANKRLQELKKIGDEAEIKRLQEEKALLEDNDNLVKQMWKAGCLKRNENGNMDMITNPEEREQLRQQRELEEQIV